MSSRRAPLPHRRPGHWWPRRSRPHSSRRLCLPTRLDSRRNRYTFQSRGAGSAAIRTWSKYSNWGSNLSRASFPRHLTEPVERGPLRLVKCDGPGTCNLVQLAHNFVGTALWGQLRLPIRAQPFDGPPSAWKSGSDPLQVRDTVGCTRRRHRKQRRHDTCGLPRSVPKVGDRPDRIEVPRVLRPGIEVIPDFFSADVMETAVGDTKASVITSSSMFYNLEDPIHSCARVADSLAVDGVWVFEQSYLPLMLERNAYDTVCQEHVEYYSLLRSPGWRKWSVSPWWTSSSTT